jgi:hypothetical protein
MRDEPILVPQLRDAEIGLKGEVTESVGCGQFPAAMILVHFKLG